MHNMQQNRHNHAKLIHEFQFHMQPKIRWKLISHKSATKIFGRSNIRRKIPLAGRMSVKNSAGVGLAAAAAAATSTTTTTTTTTTITTTSKQ